MLTFIIKFLGLVCLGQSLFIINEFIVLFMLFN